VENRNGQNNKGLIILRKCKSLIKPVPKLQLKYFSKKANIATVHSLGRLEWQELIHMFIDEFVQRTKFLLLNNFLAPDKPTYKTLFDATIDASQC